MPPGKVYGQASLAPPSITRNRVGRNAWKNVSLDLQSLSGAEQDQAGDYLARFLRGTLVLLTTNERKFLANLLHKIKNMRKSGALLGEIRSKNLPEQRRMGLSIQSKALQHDPVLMAMDHPVSFLNLRLQRVPGRVYFFEEPERFLDSWEKGKIPEPILTAMNMRARPSQEDRDVLLNAPVAGLWLAMETNMDFDTLYEPKRVAGKLGGRFRGGRIQHIFTNTVWIKAGQHWYRIGLEQGRLVLQLYTANKSRPLGNPQTLTSGRAFSVGRHAEADLQVTGDPELSRIHMILRGEVLGPFSYVLEIVDRHSKKGTQVHYQRAQPEQENLDALGKAMLESLKSRIVNRLRLLDKTRNDVPAFSISLHPKHENFYEVHMHPSFFEPTIPAAVVAAYRKVLEFIVNADPALATFLAKPENAAMYLDHYALSDFQMLLAHRVHEGVSEDPVRFVRNYLYAAQKGQLESRKDNWETASKYRKFRLHLCQVDSELRKECEKQLQINNYVPTRIVLRNEASAVDWADPGVMIVDERGYRGAKGRRVPLSPEEHYPPEKIILARWMGRPFMFYTSRSHTLNGVEVHQWRNCDMVLRHWFVKQSPENLDDVSGRLGVMLDDILYSGGMEFVPENRLLGENVDKLNDALAGREPWKRLIPPKSLRDSPEIQRRVQSSV